MSVATEDLATREANARLFMALFLGSWSIGFVALFVAQLYLRLDAISWPPAGSPAPPLALTGVSSLVAIASSAAFHFGLTRIERDEKSGLQLGLGLASGLAFLFLMLQMAAGFQAQARGLDWREGVYEAVFWITGGFHFLHVVVGLVAGVWLTLRARAYSAQSHLPVRLWGYYWHSIGLIWLLIYLLVFVL